MLSNYDPGTGYEESPWPPIRNAVLAVLEQSRPHTCWGLLEIDVTETLARLKRCQDALRLAVSLHAFVIHSLARAAAAHPAVMTYRHGRRLVTFSEADICTAIDRRILGHRVPAIHCVRGAQRKSLARIGWELRAAINLQGPPDPAIPVRRRVAGFPAFLRRGFNLLVRRNPHWVRRLYGTLAVTQLRSPGLNAAFWGLPPTVCTLTASVGGLVDRLGLDGAGRAVPRRSLCVAGGADHAVVDGMALSRFTAEFVRLMEAGSALDDQFIRETRDLASADPVTRGARPIPR